MNLVGQNELCYKLNVEFVESKQDSFIGLSENISSNSSPIHGLRHPIENGSSGWYVWAGEYSASENFFKPHCVIHLIEIKPEIIKYLGLPPGYRFLIDNNGFEDIWFDEKLL